MKQCRSDAPTLTLPRSAGEGTKAAGDLGLEGWGQKARCAD